MPYLRYQVHAQDGLGCRVWVWTSWPAPCPMPTASVIFLHCRASRPIPAVATRQTPVRPPASSGHSAHGAGGSVPKSGEFLSTPLIYANQQVGLHGRALPHRPAISSPTPTERGQSVAALALKTLAPSWVVERLRRFAACGPLSGQ